METSLRLSSKETLVMIDSASEYLGAWLQFIPMVHQSTFYNWI